MIFLCERKLSFFIGKNLYSPLYCSSLATSSTKISVLYPFLYLQTPLRLFTSDAESRPRKSPFILDYLIGSVGLSPDEAIKASKHVVHIKSPSNADSVLRFFKQNGFTGDDIKRIILRYPRLLSSNVDSTLKPKIEGLTKLGFSETDIVSLVTAIPVGLHYMSYKNMLPRIEFLRGILGSNKYVVKALSTDLSLLSCNLEKSLKPKLTFLRECHITDAGIISMITKVRHLMGRPLSFLNAIAKRVEEFGFPFESKMFCHVFSLFAGYNSDAVNTKIKLFGQLGFSEAEVLLAVKKSPYIIGLSEKNLQETVAFLVNEVGLELSYVINHPYILNLSLNRRLIPRNYVLQLLKAKGHLTKKLDFYSIVALTEANFIKKFILPYRKTIPNLLSMYTAASTGIVYS